MPKLILAAAALLLDKPPTVRGIGAHPAKHARTRSREDTRRLRRSRTHEARFDLRALDLTRRH